MACRAQCKSSRCFIAQGGLTPVHIAASSGHVNVLRSLLNTKPVRERAVVQPDGESKDADTDANTDSDYADDLWELFTGQATATNSHVDVNTLTDDVRVCVLRFTLLGSTLCAYSCLPRLLVGRNHTSNGRRNHMPAGCPLVPDFAARRITRRHKPGGHSFGVVVLQRRIV